jgi:RNA polymerase sigma-70 factor (ECF subfamily)
MRQQHGGHTNRDDDSLDHCRDSKPAPNHLEAGGVLLGDRWPEPMYERVAGLPGTSVTDDSDVAREFEARLMESSTLAFRVAYSVLRHRQDAEDVAQEAFARAHRQFLKLRDRDRFRAWLVRMTWRLAIDRQRSERRRARREAVPEHLAPSPTILDDLAARERSSLLWNAIDALPRKLRVVVVLAGIEGHDLREVARLLTLPEGTVKSRLFAARARLREQLQWTIKS